MAGPTGKGLCDEMSYVLTDGLNLPKFREVHLITVDKQYLNEADLEKKLLFGGKNDKHSL